jgi:phage-related protein
MPNNFFGNEIIFDGKSSLDYDLRIASMDTGGTGDGDAGSESQLIQDYLLRRSSPYFLGRTQHTPLAFNITLMNFDSKFFALDRSAVERWLLGRSGYKTLSIVQEDMQEIIFNAFIDKATIKYVGNIARGITLSVKCKEPWGFESQKTLVKTYSSNVNDTFTFYNSSDEDGYLYPNLWITASGTPSSIQIINQSDSNRSTVFSTVYANQNITLDCDKQMLWNDAGLNMMQFFNKQFLRLIPGINSIQLIGSLTNFQMTYQFARKVGG